MSERDVAERAQRGDESAFEQLVRPHLDLAFRTAWIVTRDAAAAEDATQSALIKAHANLRRFRPDAPFRPWFLRIVANEARNAVRARTRRRTTPLTSEIPVEPGDLAAISETRERSEWLLAHINRLPENDRLVIHCRYTLELSEAEMASVLGCARGTVKSRLHHALARHRLTQGTPLPYLDCHRRRLRVRGALFPMLFTRGCGERYGIDFGTSGVPAGRTAGTAQADRRAGAGYPEND